MDYEDRLIIYIDILGFTNFINYTSETRVNSSNKILRISNFLNLVKKFFTVNDITLSKTRQVTSFSDLIVVSINLNEIENIDLEIKEIFYLLLTSYLNGFLLRGSIVYGKLIHTENTLFGPGLINAYDRERTMAKFPRIIIDDVIVSDLLDLENISKLPQNCKDFIFRDSDGVYYIDIFYSIRENVDNFWEYLQLIKSICNILIDMMDNPLLKEKYLWLKDKFVLHINKNKQIFKHYLENDITKDDLEVIKMMIYEIDKNEAKKML